MTIFASETCALDILQIDNYREIMPGEMVTVDKDGVKCEFFAESKRKSQCVFELIYFARPDSSIFSKSVHVKRKRMGAALAEVETVKGDIVMSVPDSGNCAALGYAKIRSSA